MQFFTPYGLFNGGGPGIKLCGRLELWFLHFVSIKGDHVLGKLQVLFDICLECLQCFCELPTVGSLIKAFKHAGIHVLGVTLEGCVRRAGVLPCPRPEPMRLCPPLSAPCPVCPIAGVLLVSVTPLMALPATKLLFALCGQCYEKFFWGSPSSDSVVCEEMYLFSRSSSHNNFHNCGCLSFFLAPLELFVPVGWLV